MFCYGGCTSFSMKHSSQFTPKDPKNEAEVNRQALSASLVAAAFMQYCKLSNIADWSPSPKLPQMKWGFQQTSALADALKYIHIFPKPLQQARRLDLMPTNVLWLQEKDFPGFEIGDMGFGIFCPPERQPKIGSREEPAASYQLPATIYLNIPNSLNCHHLQPWLPVRLINNVKTQGTRARTRTAIPPLAADKSWNDMKENFTDLSNTALSLIAAS
jgi:hypothetical protein